MRRRRFELAAWEVYECGKPWREADADVAEAIDFCDYYAREMLRLAEPQRRDVPGEENAYFYEPRGVAVVIAPWNFPLAILCGMTAAALVTGNTVIMKPAEQSSVIAAKLMEVFAGGRPAAGRRQLPARRRRGDRPDAGRASRRRPDRLHRLARRRPVDQPRRPPRRRRARTTSSASSPRWAARTRSSSTTTPTSTKRCSGVVASAFGYAGPEVLGLLAGDRPGADLRRSSSTGSIEATRSLKIGPAEDPGCTVGPVIDAEARQRILELHRERQEGGEAASTPATLGVLANEGYYVAPHIFADVPPDAVIAQEEIFGPVLAVIKAQRPRRRARDRQRHALRPDRRLLLAQPRATSTASSASSASATSTSTARSPAPWSTASRSAASSSPASAPRPAAPIICCNSSSRARSPRTRCAAASRRLPKRMFRRRQEAFDKRCWIVDNAQMPLGFAGEKNLPGSSSLEPTFLFLTPWESHR